MDAEEPANRLTPDWLTEPCPDWCTREHREDDDPEDRVHQDDGTVFPAIVARVDPVDLRRTAVSAEMVVQRTQSVLGDPQVWVLIGETETAHRLIIAAESIPRLRAGLT